MSATHQVVITLGSNIDKERNLPAAVRLLAERANVIAVSQVYETPAVGTQDEQSSYFNAAILLETGLSPAALKDGLLSDVESLLDRRRSADKFAPRTIDLDIALYDREVLEYIPADGRPRHVPDPDLVRYAHIALPVADLLPDAVHPEVGDTLKSIADRLQRSADNKKSVIRIRSEYDLRKLIANAHST